MGYWRRNRKRLSCAILLLTLGSCADDGQRSLDLLGDPAEEDRYRDQRERQMDIRVKIKRSAEPEYEGDLTPRQLASYVLFPVCAQELNIAFCDPWLVVEKGGDVDALPTFTNLVAAGCSMSLCHARLALCTANKLMEVSSQVQAATFMVTTGPTILQYSSEFLKEWPAGLKPPPYDVTVGPQDAESAATLLEDAFHFSSWAATAAAEALRKAAGRVSTDSGCASADLAATYGTQVTYQSYGENREKTGNVTIGEALASSMTEATLVAENAAEKARQALVSVADSSFSEAMDIGRSSKLAWTASRLSRARAAHLLAGGPLAGGYPDLPGGVCPLEELTDAGEKALDFLHLAGAHPKAVFATKDVTFDALFTADVYTIGAQTVNDFSLRKRLAQRLGDPTLLTMSTAEFLERHQLSTNDFTEARLHLANQASAFARDTSLQLPRIKLASAKDALGNLVSQETTYPWWDATATTPTAPPAAHYRVATRFAGITADNSRSYSDGSAGAAPQPAYARSGLAQLLDYASSVASDLVGQGTLPNAPALDVLGTYLTGQGVSTVGRAELCYFSSSVNYVRVRVYGTREAAQYAVVKDSSGLRCALEGQAGAGGCDVAAHKVPITLNSYSIAGDTSMAGTRNYLEGWMIAPNTTPNFYLVRRPVGTADVPGVYQAVAGIRLAAEPTPTYSYEYCVLAPINPRVDALVAETLTPSTKLCSRPEQSCAGPGYFSKLPLENELSSDGDNIESSWRVALQRAKDAAGRADLLADDLISRGLEIDRRIETAQEELETICGGAVNLFSAFPSDMTGVRGAACTDLEEGKPCAGALGQICMNRRCVRDALATMESAKSYDPMAAKLSECLGSEGVEPFVTLGSRPVCIWQKKAGDKRICEAIAGVEKPCPYPADEKGQCGSVANLPTASYDLVTVTKTLNLFRQPEEDEEGAANTETPPACAALRDLRDNGVSQQNLDKAIRYLNLTRLKPIARRVGYEARVDDYSAVIVDQVPVFETGDAFRTPVASPRWPCGNGPYPSRDDPSGAVCTLNPAWPELSDSLFCSYTSACADATTESGRQHRAMMNHRLGRSVLAARILTGEGMDGFRGPFLPDMDRMKSRADYELWPSYRCTADSAGTSKALSDGRTVKVATSTYYHVAEIDIPGDDEHAKYTPSGQAVCFFDPTSVIWTDISGPLLSAPVFTKYLRTCGTEPSYSTCPSAFPMMFKDYGLLHGKNPGNVTGRVWGGLGGWSASNTGDPFDNGLRSLLLDPRLADELVIAYGDKSLHLDPRLADELVIAYGDKSLYDYSTTYMTDEELAIGDLTAYWTDDLGKKLNAIGLGRQGLRARDILDGLELLCEVERRDGKRKPTCSEPPTAETMQDMGLVEDSLRCVANQLLQRAEVEVLTNVPMAALQGLQASYEFQGERGAASGQFAAALGDLRSYQREIHVEIDGLASDIHQLSIALRRNQIAENMADIQKLSTISSQLAACASSMGGMLAPKNLAGGAISAAATCANTAVQIGLALEQNNLTNEDIELQGELTWEDFRSKFRQRSNAIQDMSEKLEETTTALRASLASIETQRAKGRRELGKALMLGTDATGRQFAVNTVTRRYYNTLQVRYERARLDAIRLAWLARRAIEQRLGISLAEMRQDLELVDAPASWADSLCTMTGVNYARLRDERALLVDNVASEYIGDYVTRLERLVQSYEHDFPFQDATDTAVVSLRDDVSDARATCVAPAPNLLGYSGRLDQTTDPEATTMATWSQVSSGPSDTELALAATQGPSTPFVWTTAGCATTLQNCVYLQGLNPDAGLDPLKDRNRPIPLGGPNIGDVRGYRVTFASGWDGTGPSPLGPTAALAQKVTLAPGQYRLSWYGQTVDYDPGTAVKLRGAAGSAATGVVATGVVSTTQRGWTRYYFLFSAADSGTYQVAIVPSTTATRAHSVEIAALMLENVGHLFDGRVDLSAITKENYRPGMYVATKQAGVALDEVCEDTTGEAFRANKWRRACVRLCPAGFGSSCTDGEFHCYWEYGFDITLEGIEHGGTLKQAGFAYGNYNYRIDSLALNFVGTGLRGCEDSFFPSTCYASGNIPYTIEHLGPYQVRNHSGQVYEAALFEGRVEHGRGLAAERYLTNPLSSADRALVEPYEHRELRGRPLTGSYVLRIWDTDGFDFNRLEDIQVLLDYRYWTRFQ